MVYLYSHLEEDIKQDIESLAPVRKDRGKRYGTPGDTLANVRGADPEGAWRGAFVNARDCMARLASQFLTPIVKQDRADFDNASGDLLNYVLYMRILERHARKPPEPPKAIQTKKPKREGGEVISEYKIEGGTNG